MLTPKIKIKPAHTTTSLAHRWIQAKARLRQFGLTAAAPRTWTQLLAPLDNSRMMRYPVEGWVAGIEFPSECHHTLPVTGVLEIHIDLDAATLRHPAISEGRQCGSITTTGRCVYRFDRTALRTSMRISRSSRGAGVAKPRPVGRHTRMTVNATLSTRSRLFEDAAWTACPTFRNQMETMSVCHGHTSTRFDEIT